jgi:hypothetical protein
MLRGTHNATSWLTLNMSLSLLRSLMVSAMMPTSKARS